MSLRPQPIAPVPPDTVRVARAAFPKGTPYLTLRDALGTIFQDDNFADLYSREGQPGLAPWQLALVTVMQFRGFCRKFYLRRFAVSSSSPSNRAS